LSELSLQLQNRDISLVEAQRSICLQIYVFEGMVKKSGKYATETAKAATEAIFL
jgi:hypothetical protein